jgi:hypothetical protein
MECRQEKLGFPPIKVLLKLRKILQLGEQLQKGCEGIFSAYQKIALVPLNLEVHAARIGQEAATILVISSQYGIISRQIQQETEKLLSTGSMGGSIKQNVQVCQFDVCNLLLTKELIAYFKDETEESSINKDYENAFLNELNKNGIENAEKSLTAVETIFGRFESIFQEIKKLTTALDIVGITGKVEAVQVKKDSAELLGLLDDLMGFKTTLKQSLKEIDDIGSNLIDQTREVRRELEAFLNI